jgi:hypothetical protein
MLFGLALVAVFASACGATPSNSENSEPQPTQLAGLSDDADISRFCSRAYAYY